MTITFSLSVVCPFICSTNALPQKTSHSDFESHTRRTDDVMTEAEREELAVAKRRAEGTPCNKENFEAWQAKFLLEMAAARDDNDEDGNKSGKRKEAKTKEVDKSGRMTGYELFSNKMVNLEALEAAAEEAELGFEGDEDLFQDDVDLDDLDFDDEDDEGDEEGDDEELDI